MLTLFVDHNIEGHALLLWETLETEGWPELLPLQIVTFAHMGLSIESTDRVVWRFAQVKRMLLLTANRRMKGEDTFPLMRSLHRLRKRGHEIAGTRCSQTTSRPF